MDISRSPSHLLNRKEKTIPEVTTGIVRPRASADQTFSPREVAAAYNYPLNFTGKGYSVGIVELGGGFDQANLDAYFASFGVPSPAVTSVSVQGAQNAMDGPEGADGEVQLDIEVVGAVAPGAAIRVYFAPNSDSGFLEAIRQAAEECDVVSVSWGGPESYWDSSAMDEFEAVIAEAKTRGVYVFCASGDTGSRDGTRTDVVDFPASAPSAIGCGGTKLTTNQDGSRASEVTWDDSDTQSATGGGVSKHFAGRQVPDVAGNASPTSGYEVRVDGEEFAIGGTSAVAPLYAALAVLLSEAIGARLGTKCDLIPTLVAHPEICYDVTVGDNGGFKAGPGRDETTGFGVVDGARLLAVIGSEPTEPTQPVEPTALAADEELAKALRGWMEHPRASYYARRLKDVARVWLRNRAD